MSALPDGTVTFLFTDIEGSTRLWDLYPEAMRTALEWHDTQLRQRDETAGGQVFKTVGDGIFAVFSRAGDALQAARQIQNVLHTTAQQEVGMLSVRIALLTGVADVRKDDYFGNLVNRTARLCAIAHGGQTLLARTTVDRLQAENAPLPGGVTLNDLGLHRLRDLRDTEHVYQLVCAELPDQFPPLRSLELFPHNLPYQLNTFIGREEPVADVFRLLTGREIKERKRRIGGAGEQREGEQANRRPWTSPCARLVTLTGTGGCGKTRLSLQIAAEVLDEFADGVWFVEFGPVHDPVLLPQTIAHALRANVEQAGRSVCETLIDTLKQKSLLLILDNCEHVIDACAHLVEELLRACPNLHILATSREILGLRGETTYRVAPLPTPLPQKATSLEELMRYEAVRLFVDRAESAMPTGKFTDQNAAAIAQICHHLDGIPLALELAARRVRGMTVEAIAEQLSDSLTRWTGNRTDPPRQRTLEGAIDWSYILLPPQEKTLLTRLSVFTGGFTLDAVEAVCADEEQEMEPASEEIQDRSAVFLSSSDIFDLLLRLVDKSLVMFDETQEGHGRYRLLETIRQYSLQRLKKSGEVDALRQRHARWFLQFARQAETEMQGPAQVAWLDKLEREHDNLRSALHWSAEGEDRLRLASALWRFWYTRGFYTEGRNWLESALAQSEQIAPDVRAKALNAAGILAMTQGDCEAAQHLYTESLALYRTLADRLGEAKTLNNLGLVAHRLADFATMRARLEQCLPIYLELHEEGFAARVLNNLGVAATSQAEYEVARQYLADSLLLARKIGDKNSMANALSNFGELDLKRNDIHRADTHFRESLTMRVELGNRQGISLSLYLLGKCALLLQEDERAIVLLAASAALREAVMAPLSDSMQAEYEEDRKTLLTRREDESFHTIWQRGRSLDAQQAVLYALNKLEQETAA